MTASMLRLEDWFELWVADLRVVQTPDTPERTWPHSMQRTILEALSDASGEQFLNPLTAIHLRKWGQALFGPMPGADVTPWFWVRSEWAKTDISYGIAPESFAGGTRGFDAAWVRGATGDRGQIEVKVCYSHRPSGPISTMARQLQERRCEDHSWGRQDQRYHGLVWIFDDGRERELAKTLITEARSAGLVCESFSPIASGTSLGRLWPSLDGKEYRCSLQIALMALSD